MPFLKVRGHIRVIHLNGKMELTTLVIYDIEDDKIRNLISETCKDYGLERIQFSAFMGPLNRNRRQELYLKLFRIVESHIAKIVIQPICERDERERKVIINEKKKEDR